MYVPSHYAVDDRATLDQVIRDNSFGLLVNTVDEAPFATHLPFLLEENRLVGHMARANPQWQSFQNDAEVMCVFQGSHGYVSPRWFAGDEVVPTWNYVAVHVYGVPRIVDDPDSARAMQQRLVAAHEGGMETPWSMDEMPEGYLTGMLRAIVNFEIPINRIEGKFKLSQNKTAENRARVISALDDSAREGDRAVAKLMAAREPA